MDELKSLPTAPPVGNDPCAVPPSPAVTAPPPSEPLAVTAPDNQIPTMWNDSKLLKQAYKAAQFLASSDLVPEQSYKNKPQNCLLALDFANRMNLAPLLVMQNLYIVKGKPAWSGQFCISLINASGRFSPLDFVEMEDGGCYCQSTRLRDGKLCVGTLVSWDMVKAEGWLDKNGSKWKTMPALMFRYRAAAFFARTFCPELLMGVPTADEVRDVTGYEPENAPEKIVITMEDL